MFCTGSCSCFVPRMRAGEAQWHQDSPEWGEVQGCNMSKAVGENQSNSYLGEYPHPDDFVPAGKAERKSQTPRDLTPEFNPSVPAGTLWIPSTPAPGELCTHRWALPGVPRAPAFPGSIPNPNPAVGDTQQHFLQACAVLGMCSGWLRC